MRWRCIWRLRSSKTARLLATRCASWSTDDGSVSITLSAGKLFRWCGTSRKSIRFAMRRETLLRHRRMAQVRCRTAVRQCRRVRASSRCRDADRHSRQGRLHRPTLLRQHRLRRPVGLLLRLAAPLAEARLPRPLRHARRAQGRGTGGHALPPRQQGEGGGVLPRRHDAGDAPPGRAGAPGLPGHHLLRLQAGRERRRRRHRQHRLGDLPRRGDPRRLRHQRHLADANGARQTA